MDKHYLDPLFNPRRIVVLVAAGSDTDDELVHALAGSEVPVEVVVFDAGHSRLAPSSPVDLAVLRLPSEWVAGALEECGRLRIRAVIVFATGAEPPEGAASATETSKAWREIAHRHQIRLLGPQTMGLQRPHRALNASRLGDTARAGDAGAGHAVGRTGRSGPRLGVGDVGGLFGDHFVGRQFGRQHRAGARLSCRRPGHPEHPALSRRRHRRAQLHERAARRGRRQAGDRPQGRHAPGGQARRIDPFRRAGRPQLGVQRRVAARGRRARPFFHAIVCRGALPCRALPALRPAAGDRHQRRRTRRAGRRLGGGKRRAGRADQRRPASPRCALCCRAAPRSTIRSTWARKRAPPSTSRR